MRRRFRVAAGAAIVAAAAGAGITYSLTTDSSAHGPKGISIAEGSDRVRSSTPQDWVTFADAVVIGRVSKEVDVTESASADLDPNEQYQGRQVAVAVTKTIWVNKHLPDYNPNVSPGVIIPSNLTMDAMGKLPIDGEMRVAALDDSPRMEVGHTYVIPLGRFTSGGWAPVASTAILPYDGTVIGQGEWEGDTATSLTADAFPTGSVAGSVVGKPISVLSTLLATATPNPSIPPAGDPDQRMEALRAANDSTAEPDPTSSESESAPAGD